MILFEKIDIRSVKNYKESICRNVFCKDAEICLGPMVSNDNRWSGNSVRQRIFVQTHLFVYVIYVPQVDECQCLGGVCTCSEFDKLRSAGSGDDLL